MTNELTEDIINLYCNENKPLKEIATIYSMGKETVRNVLVKNNISRRTTSECCELGQCGFEKGFHPKTEFKKGDVRLMGENHPNYKGGCIDKSTGYKLVNVNGEQLLEHRYIWSKYFGEIPENHVIHHIDGNKLNNDIDNLMCLSRAEHIIEHLHNGVGR